MAVDPLQNISSANLTKDVLDITYISMTRHEQEKSLLAAINNLLASKKTQLLGLEILLKIIPQCTKESLSENITTWSSLCVVQHPEDSTKEVKLRTLAKLLEIGHDLDHFCKKFNGEHLNLTVKACLNCKTTNEKVAGLLCLRQCLKRFPSWFTNHKKKVEEYLLVSLKSGNVSEVKIAGKCFVCCLQSGPSGNFGVNYVNNFQVEFNRLCKTIQGLCCNFFGNLDFMNFSEIEGSSVEFGDNHNLNNRLVNFLIFLKSLLAEPFSVEKRITPKYVVELVHLILSQHICFADSPGRTEKFSILKKLQLIVLEIVRVLLKGFQSVFLPFSITIESSLLKIFQRSAVCPCFDFDTLKVNIYKTLIMWMESGNVVNESHFQNKLIPVLLQDLSLGKKSIVLNTGKRESVEDPLRRGENGLLERLDVLKAFVNNVNVLEEKFLEDIVAFTLTALGEYQVGKMRKPFTDVNFQVQLYEILISFLSLEGSNCSPSLHSIIHLLTKGASGSNCRISRVCNKGLDLLEKISQPVCPSLNISPPKAINTHNGENFELFDTTRKEKEIKIISNILISEPDLHYQHPKEDIERSIQCVNNLDMDVDVVNVEDSPEELDVLEEEQSEGEEKSAPETISSPAPEDVYMFDSFQDVVQE